MGSGKGGSSWFLRNQRLISVDACNFGAGCKSSKRSKDKFCDKHSKCDWHRCDAKVLDVEGSDFKYSAINHAIWLCRDHSCKAKDKDKQCYEERDKNSQYCKEHSKEFQCKMPKCDSDRDGSERYCKKHHCEVDDCHRRILSLADGEMAGRDKKKCYKHQRCEASRDCKNYSLWDPDKTPTRLCVNHSKCEFFQGCNGFAQGDSRFCTDHEPMPAPTLHVPMSQQSLVDIALPMHAPPQAAVRPENAVLHSSLTFAHSMGKRERNNRRGTIIILLLPLEQHLARVAGLVAMTPGAFRGHFDTSNTIIQHIRIRFRPQKLIVDMNRMITQMIIT
ncbi:hypothetical protein FACUT_2152 [Fusarium acutatum]|uniref:Uncharacterized protein n=1 Tax=Fusarium acutatum TaxID=78861 RepID=A0A8H4NP22_9HYPO|nr:hypothetical protein FACUT_2152 [Fusarium acutatum]